MSSGVETYLGFFAVWDSAEGVNMQVNSRHLEKQYVADRSVLITGILRTIRRASFTHSLGKRGPRPRGGHIYMEPLVSTFEGWVPASPCEHSLLELECLLGQSRLTFYLLSVDILGQGFKPLRMSLCERVWTILSQTGMAERS